MKLLSPDSDQIERQIVPLVEAPAAFSITQAKRMIAPPPLAWPF